MSPQLLQEFIRSRQEAGLGSATIRHINATLRAALSQAQKWGLVHQNVTLPRTVKFRPTILTPEAASLLTFISGHWHEALFTVALTMGLRRGELLGLRWKDLDLEKASLEGSHSLERMKGSGLHLSEPKSARSKRKLRIPKISLLALTKHRSTQAEQRCWAGSKWKEGDFVFTTGVGTPVHPDELSRELPPILAAAGLPRVRFHDLRHSCATLLLSLGVHAKLVQETLGHSSYQLTMDTYSHTIPALRNEVADRMDSVFAPTPTTSPTRETVVLVN